MSEIGKIFQSSADNFGDTMFGKVGLLGFEIPEYQRPYDWDRKNVKRLIQDCLNGFYRASKSDTKEYTFLGTIILASSETQYHQFKRQPLLIVDGQQRLTTLLLLTCSLYESIENSKSGVLGLLDSEVEEWLERECSTLLRNLSRCTTGKEPSASGDIPFPRITRSQDRTDSYSEKSGYRSPIAVFLRAFEQFCSESSAQFPPSIDLEATDAKHLQSIYKYIGERISEYVFEGSEEDEISVVTREHFIRNNCRQLFYTPLPRKISEQLVKLLSNSSASEGLVRLLLFSSYLLHYIVLACVVAPSEDIAFDIFDALNTTGEPLTALETIKPHVIRFENSLKGFKGSESESSWNELERNINEKHAEPNKRQRETKELITSFATYYLGQKLGLDLKLQRDKLRQYYRSASISTSDPQPARKFVRSLGQLAAFRSQYWDTNGIDSLPNQVSQDNDLRLCLRYIADTNTKMAIPILARYWIEHGTEDPEMHFLQATRAVAAFLTLRRSMTGGTKGIDSDFRNLMKKGAGSSVKPLCVGPDFSNRILDIDNLKEGFRHYLNASPFRVTGKSTWLARAQEDIPLAASSNHICRFLLLAASHHARPDCKHPGLLTTDDVVPGPGTNLFDYQNWVGGKYATVEHVAPDSDSNIDWDRAIYARTATRQTIGNLVLLPEAENNAIGNASWVKKRTFFQALSATSQLERDELVELAANAGYTFGNQTLKLLDKQESLSLLRPLSEVENWTESLIKERTENILSLAWDRISPWLFG